MRKLSLGLGVVASLFAMSASAHAYSVNVQVRAINDTTGDTAPAYTGTAAAPDSGTNWNSYFIADGFGHNAPSTNGHVLTALEDSQSNPTPLAFSVTAHINFPYGTGTPGFYAEPGFAFADIANNLQGSYAFTGWGGEATYMPSATDDFAITGLTPGVPIDLYLYGDYTSVPGNQTIYTIDGHDMSITNSSAGATAGVFVQGQDYALFKGILPDALGKISGSFTTPNLTNHDAGGFLNGIQITPSVPLPPAAYTALAMLAGLTVIGKIKRVTAAR